MLWLTPNGSSDRDVLSFVINSAIIRSYAHSHLDLSFLQSLPAHPLEFCPLVPFFVPRRLDIFLVDWQMQLAWIIHR